MSAHRIEYFGSDMREALKKRDPAHAAALERFLASQGLSWESVVAEARSLVYELADRAKADGDGELGPEALITGVSGFLAGFGYGLETGLTAALGDE